MQPQSTLTNRQAAIRLKRFFRRNGYVRVADPKRRQTLGSQIYKKGSEVRLIAASKSELAQMRKLIRQVGRRVGFKAGHPFQRGLRVVQPIYGQKAVEWFLRSRIRTHKQPSLSNRQAT